jgi:hypothetical protein
MSQNNHQEHTHHRSFVPMSQKRITSRFIIVGNAETPINYSNRSSRHARMERVSALRLCPRSFGTITER